MSYRRVNKSFAFLLLFVFFKQGSLNEIITYVANFLYTNSPAKKNEHYLRTHRLKKVLAFQNLFIVGAARHGARVLYRGSNILLPEGNHKRD